MNSFMSIFINISTPDSKYLVVYEEEEEKEKDVEQKQEAKQDENTESGEKEASAAEHTAKRMRLDHDGFLQRLNVYQFDTLNEMKGLLGEKIGLFKQDYGVLCFLYSLLLTKVNFSSYILLNMNIISYLIKVYL